MSLSLLYTRGIEDLWGVHVSQQVPKFLLMLKLPTPSPILSISSSVKPFWPIDVQQYDHWLVASIWADLLGTKIPVDTVSPQPLD